MSRLPRRGELWWCELPELGRRPVLILSRDPAIPRLRRPLVAICTTTIRGLATEVLLEPGDDPVNQPTAINFDSLESVSVSLFIEKIGRLTETRLDQACRALGSAVACSW